MNLRRLVGTAVAVAATSVAFTTTARADHMATFSAFDPNNRFEFTSNGAGGGVLVTTTEPLGPPGAAAPSPVQGIAVGPAGLPQLNAPAYLDFGPLTMTGVTSTPTSIEATFSTAAPLSVFTIYGANPNGTINLSNVLLTGYFEDAKLSFDSTTPSAAHLVNFAFSSVVYTAGTYYTTFPGSATDPALTGTLDFTLTLNAPLSVTGNNLSSFYTTQFTGEFTATADTNGLDPVPEPEEYAVMGMASLALCGLMLRARRRATVRSMGGFAA